MNDFEAKLKETGEVGFVTEVVGAIVMASGIPQAKPDELIIFESGETGQVFSLKQDLVEILTFSKNPIKVGSRLARTGRFLEVPVGNELLSNVIDPFGNSFESHKHFTKPKKTYPIQTDPPGITSRKSIKRYFETGVSIVDLMVPLGRGQRQLIIGDRKTGKSSFLLQTVAYAAKQGDICIYASIGKNKIDIKRTEEYFIANNVIDHVMIVASSSQDAPGVIFLTPYSAMTIAEYFRDQGRDVLVILDDLSTHAKFYREIALLGRRFPGRDSYPGDLFYIHARLIERAGNFHYKDSEASITCFPVVETLQADLSGYIPTNVMSMTDGHIYFDSNLFSQGRRPAVNPFISVTRVGRQTQSDSKRSISRELLSFLTLFDKMQNIIHFGSELTESVKIVIQTGRKILELFDQESNKVVPSNVQSIVLSIVWGDEFKNLEIPKLNYYRERISELYQKDVNYKKMVDEIVLSSNSFNEILAKTKANINRFGIDLAVPPATPVNIPQPAKPNTTTNTPQPANANKKIP